MIRDDVGVLVAARTSYFDGIPKPSEAEAVGLHNALKWVRSFALSRVQVELDSKSTVEKLLQGPIADTEEGTIIEFRKLLLRSLPNSRVSFIRRQEIHVAHNLARVSRLYARHQLFYYSLPCIAEFSRQNKIKLKTFFIDKN